VFGCVAACRELLLWPPSEIKAGLLYHCYTESFVQSNQILFGGSALTAQIKRELISITIVIMNS
jgi:hypothetical protein